MITLDAIWWCLKHRGQFAKANRTFGICRKYETCVSVVTNFGMDRTEKIRVCRRGRLIKKHYEYKEDGLIPLGPHVLFAFSIYLLRRGSSSSPSKVFDHIAAYEAETIFHSIHYFPLRHLGRTGWTITCKH